MNEHAPQILIALESSGLGQAIRQSVWAYPAANVVHVVALAVFAGAIAVMDLRLLGAFSATTPADVVRPARRAAILALSVMALSGAVLFTAEASHISLNPVFLTKMGFVAIGVVNAALAGRVLGPALAETPAGVALPPRVRYAAGLSLAVWLSVAGLGRLIAYF
jgi:hypothetical protein